MFVPQKFFYPILFSSSSLVMSLKLMTVFYTILKSFFSCIFFEVCIFQASSGQCAANIYARSFPLLVPSPDESFFREVPVKEIVSHFLLDRYSVKTFSL